MAGATRARASIHTNQLWLRCSYLVIGPPQPNLPALLCGVWCTELVLLHLLRLASSGSMLLHSLGRKPSWHSTDQHGPRRPGMRSVVTPGTRREDTVGCGRRSRARACRDRGARGVVGSRAEWGNTPGGNATPPHLSWQRRPGGAAHRGRTSPDAGDRSRRSRYARSPAA